MDVTILSRDNKTLGKGTKRLFVTNDSMTIIKNTTKFNNEYLKHRLACIPIMNDDESTFNAFCNLY